MTKACKATLIIGLRYTFATIMLQFVVANWINELKPPGVPISDIQVQSAAVGFCIASFFLASLGLIAMGITGTRAANYISFAHFTLAFVLFLLVDRTDGASSNQSSQTMRKRVNQYKLDA